MGFDDWLHDKPSYEKITQKNILPGNFCRYAFCARILGNTGLVICIFMSHGFNSLSIESFTFKQVETAMDDRVLPPANIKSDMLSKIVTISELNKLFGTRGVAGPKVVLCHGVFDLLHMGHVRHFQEARAMGDLLVVSITADAFVNKGPGKPVFSQGLRAEMLASLSCIDWVTVNDAPDALPIIDAIKPDFYAKGSDYSDAKNDITGKINVEQKKAESYGGKLAITDDITFSSSKLLNRHFDVFDQPVRDFLSHMRLNGALERLNKHLEQLSQMRVLVVGDAIIDEYRYVAPLGKSPKENMIATKFEENEVFAGGAIATANHIAGLCAQVDIMTCLGDKGGDSGHEDEELIMSGLAQNVQLLPIRRRGAPTTRKTRFIDRYYFRKLFEVYDFDDTALPQPLQTQFDQMIEEKIEDYDIVLVNDFGHGLIATETISILTKNSKFLAVNAQSNSANFGFNLITRYPRADVVFIDTPEAQLAVGNKTTDPATVVSKVLPTRMECDRFVLTLGAGGCTTWEKGKSVQTVPAFATSVVDLVGAGDAFLAVAAPFVAVGASMRDVGFMGNIAGAIKVGIVGHRSSIDAAKLMKSITGLLK